MAAPLIQVFGMIGLFLVLLALVAWVLSHFKGRGEIYPYALQPILTETEARFLESLRQAVPPHLWLVTKVRLADFLKVTVRGDDYLRYFGKISQKHADFLLVDPRTGNPVLVIELDDSTHRNKARTVASDDFKNRAFEAAGLAILRVPTARQYDITTLARDIREIT